MTSRTSRFAAGGSLLLGSTAALMGVGTLAAGADGTTFVVDTLLDHGGPGSAAACAPPTGGACTLRDAIAASNISPGTDTILFDPSLSGTIELVSNLEMLNDAVIITGPGAEILTIDGHLLSHGFLENPNNLSAPEPANFSLELSGLHLTRLNGEVEEGFTFGAVSVLTGSLNLHDVVVTDSAARYPTSRFPFINAPVSAGAFTYGFLALPSVTIERVQISDNHAPDEDDPSPNLGSLFVISRDIHISETTISGNTSTLASGPVLLGGAINVSGLTVTDNTSSGDYAGALMRCSTCTISGSIFERNSAVRFAGLVLYGDNSILYDDIESQPIRISDTIIASNNASSGSAVLLVTEESPIVLERVSIVDNISDSSDLLDPAAPTAALDFVGDLTLLSSTIANNTSNGIGFNNVSGEDPTLTSQSLNRQSSARSSFLSDALHPRRSISSATVSTRPSHLLLSHSTVTGNSGVGIARGPQSESAPTEVDVALDHALIHGNRAGDISIASTARFSLIGSPSIVPSTGIFGVPGGNNIFGVDPDLQPLERTSPLVAVVPLPLGSAAWNTGDPSFLPPPDTDQRGLPRVVEIIDIGAYEVQTPLVLPAFTG